MNRGQSVKTLLERKAWSNPDSSHSIIAIHNALKKQLPDQLKRKMSSKSKPAARKINEMDQEVKICRKKSKERNTTHLIAYDVKKAKKRSKNSPLFDQPERSRSRGSRSDVKRGTKSNKGIDKKKRQKYAIAESHNPVLLSEGTCKV